MGSGTSGGKKKPSDRQKKASAASKGQDKERTDLASSGVEKIMNGGTSDDNKKPDNSQRKGSASSEHQAKECLDLSSDGGGGEENGSEVVGSPKEPTASDGHISDGGEDYVIVDQPCGENEIIEGSSRWYTGCQYNIIEDYLDNYLRRAESDGHHEGGGEENGSDVIGSLKELTASDGRISDGVKKIMNGTSDDKNKPDNSQRKASVSSEAQDNECLDLTSDGERTPHKQRNPAGQTPGFHVDLPKEEDQIVEEFILVDPPEEKNQIVEGYSRWNDSGFRIEDYIVEDFFPCAVCDGLSNSVSSSTPQSTRAGSNSQMQNRAPISNAVVSTALQSYPGTISRELSTDAPPFVPPHDSAVRYGEELRSLNTQALPPRQGNNSPFGAHVARFQSPSTSRERTPHKQRNPADQPPGFDLHH